jgi:diaminopimelate epimerase
MKFHKYHGLGNDYIVIDPRESDVRVGPVAAVYEGELKKEFLEIMSSNQKNAYHIET